MTDLSDDSRRRAFATWLRTGRLPSTSEDGVELKFNPWHDPANGRFTFAGAGQRFSAGTINRTDAGERTFSRVRRREPGKPPAGERDASAARSTERGQIRARQPASRQGAGKSQPQRVTATYLRSGPSSPTVEFVRGAVEGVYDTAVRAAEGTYSTLTTNPVTTARNAGRAIAGTIDAVIAAEDTPARVQVSRAADAVSRASARDLGHATGKTVGDVALMAAPGATLSKVATLRRLRVEGPRGVTYKPLEMRWVKENLGRDSPAKRYNDTAPGARPNEAPALIWTKPDGSTGQVKFDGVQGDYFIDRKTSVRDQTRARQQVLRQSGALAQQRLIGIWEVPDQKQRIKAGKLLRKMNVTNIKVRISKQ